MMHTAYVVISVVLRFVLIFFFSSRRRHTRYWRDWSSDVCSSDLLAEAGRFLRSEQERGLARFDPLRAKPHLRARRVMGGEHAGRAWPCLEIGRASCRERV